MKKKYQLKSHIKITRDTITDILNKLEETGELPFNYDLEDKDNNWIYDYWCEYTKRFGVPNCAFFTPDHTAKKMADIANHETSGEVLDACCGTGQILKHLDRGIGFDISQELLDIAEYQKLNVFKFSFTSLETDKKDKYYLKLNNLSEIDNLPKHEAPLKKYPVIVSNPPFGKVLGTGDLGVEFMNWAYDNLEDDGSLVVLLPSNFMNKTQKKYIEIQDKFSIVHEEIMEEEFANTKINASIYLMKKIK